LIFTSLQNIFSLQGLTQLLNSGFKKYIQYITRVHVCGDDALEMSVVEMHFGSQKG
jgi:hypothetical protein